MIIFKKLRYKNLLLTGNQFTEIDLNRTKTTMLIGGNGNGKSTFLEALTFATYGKPFRNINIPQLINTKNNADMLVELEFSVLKREYKIRRGLKPKIFEIYVDDKLIDQSAASVDYQDFLEKSILKMNYKTMTQLVIIGNASYKPFMRLTPAERRLIVEDLLDIDVFSKMNTLLKTHIGDTKKELTDVNYTIDVSREKLNLYTNILNESDNNIQAQLDNNNRLIYNSEQDLNHKKSEIQVIEEEIASVSYDRTRLQKLKRKFEKLGEFGMNFKSKIKNINREIEFFDVNQKCPTCSQEILEEVRLSTIDQRKGSLSKYQAALEELEKEYQTLSVEIDTLINGIAFVNGKQQKITYLNNEIELIYNHIQGVISHNNSLSLDGNKKLTEKRHEYAKIEAEYQVLIKAREGLLERQHIQAVANILLKDDGIKTKIIRHYLPQMNQIINKYLTYLDLNVSFGLDENFNEVIKNKSKETFSYYSFSEGEKLRIDTAIMFAWREISKLKNSANTNLLILDEIFDSSLDADGIDEFLSILSNSGNDLNSFVISHRGESLADKFDRILQVERVGGFSKIRELGR